MMKGWLAFFAICVCLTRLTTGQLNAFVEVDPDTLLDDDNILLEKWKLMESGLRNMTEAALSTMLPTLTDLMISSNISGSCFRDCTKLFLGLRKLKTWAVKFLDASTKTIDGVLDLQASSLGSYDECVNNKVFSGRSGNKKAKVMFQGKYCNINYRLYMKRDETASLGGSKSSGIPADTYPEDSVFSNLNKLIGFTYSITPKMGLCVPSGCSTDDVNRMLQKASDSIGISLKAERCAVKEEKIFTPLIIGILTVYCFAGFLVALGTAIDIYVHFSKKQLRSKAIQILQAFSFIANFKKLTDTSTSLKTDCLHGMRFLSLTWVIMGHSSMLIISTNMSVPSNTDDYRSDFAAQVIANANPAVYTFFFLSGFLVCYITTKLVKIQKNPFNIYAYVIHRLWRLLPAYVFVLAFEFVKPLTGSGPLFHKISGTYTEYCRKNWWTNLLFINNFYDRNEMCLPHSWFIAVDMQLYLMALIIVLPLLRWPKIGMCIAGTVIAVCIAAAAVMGYMHDMLAIVIFTHKKRELDYYHQYHNMNPYLQAPAYVIGLLLGYCLATRSDFKVPKVLQVLGWVTSTAACLAVVYGVQKWNAGSRPNAWENTMYTGFCRTAWSLGIAWMTFCCCTGHGGVINYILSWRIWIPLSRLTYFAYLVHLPVLFSYHGNMRTIIKLDYYIGVWIILGNIAITYAVAFAGSMLIEAPFFSLEKMFLQSAKKDVKQSPTMESPDVKNGEPEKNGKI